MLKKFFIFIFALFLLAGLSVAALLYSAIYIWKTPITTELLVEPGMSAKQIGRALARHGSIQTPNVFALWVRLNRWDQSLHFGYYQFEKGLTLEQIIAKIRRGDVLKFPFRVIEGWNLTQLADFLRTQTFIPSPTLADDFLRLAHDPDFMARLGFTDIPSLEGYIPANTYFVMKPKNAEDFIRQLLAVLPQFWTEAEETRAAAIGMSRNQVLTLASIIEKETAKADERPLVSSVFHNRLKKGMLLQTDPTIIYGLKNYDANIRKSDILNPHPYNTYVHAGLPPGPISAVGKEAIHAALYPAQSDYFYFVATGVDGAHIFSKTLDDHNASVNKYQR